MTYRIDSKFIGIIFLALLIPTLCFAQPAFVPTQDADILVITHSNLRAASWENLFLQQKEDLGLTAAMLEFQDGQTSDDIAQAIACINGIYQYVVIIGDAKRNVESGWQQTNNSVINFEGGQIVPLFREDITAMSSVITVNNDAGYSSYDPDIQYGRLPASTAVEVFDYYSKSSVHLGYVATDHTASVLHLLDDIYNPWGHASSRVAKRHHDISIQLSNQYSSSVLQSSQILENDREQAFSMQMNLNTPDYVCGIGCNSTASDLLTFFQGDSPDLQNNDKFPFAFIPTCDVAGFDQYENGVEKTSVAEKLLYSSAGFIGMVAPTMALRQEVTDSFVKSFWLGIENGTISTLGDVLPVVSESFKSYEPSLFHYKPKFFVLLGDPTLPMPHVRKYNDIEIATTVVIGEGDYYISGVVSIVSGGELIIEPGARLHFSNLNSGITISGTGKLTVLGQPGSEIVFSGTSSTRQSWGGIYYLASANGTNQVLEHAFVQYAAKGIVNRMSTGYFVPKYVEIEQCELGIENKNANYGYYQNLDLHDCTNGIFVTHPTSGINSFTLYDSDIRDVDGIGLELNTMGTAYVTSSRIQSCGISGIKSYSANELNFGSATSLTDFATRVFYCGEFADSYTPAVEIQGPTYISRWEDLQIYENHNGGVMVDNGTSVTMNPAYHHLVSIGNNQVTRATYELLVGPYDNTSFDFNGCAYNLFNDMTPSVTLLQLYNGVQTNAADTWWGSTPTTEAEVLSHILLHSGSTVAISPIAGSAHGGAGWYGVQNLEETQHSLLQQAHALLDTSVTPVVDVDHACTIFTSLAEDGYLPGVYGLARALLQRGDTADQIDDTLADLIPNDSSPVLVRAKGLLRGGVRADLGLLNEARSAYLLFAEQTPHELDSLQAAYCAQQIERLQLLVAESDDGDLASFPESQATRLARVESRLTDLRARLMEAGKAGRYQSDLPTSVHLAAAYPNPFNPSITIPFALPKRGNVEIGIFNVLGQHVKTLIDEELQAGSHSVSWNGLSDASHVVASGIYFIRMDTPGEYRLQKIVMLK